MNLDEQLAESDVLSSSIDGDDDETDDDRSNNSIFSSANVSDTSPSGEPKEGEVDLALLSSASKDKPTGSPLLQVPPSPTTRALNLSNRKNAVSFPLPALVSVNVSARRDT